MHDATAHQAQSGRSRRARESDGLISPHHPQVPEGIIDSWARRHTRGLHWWCAGHGWSVIFSVTQPVLQGNDAEHATLLRRDWDGCSHWELPKTKVLIGRRDRAPPTVRCEALFDVGRLSAWRRARSSLVREPILGHTSANVKRVQP